MRYGNILSDPALVEEIGTGYDVITANIVADVLNAMAPLFGKFLKPDGKLILSGIITERKYEVVDSVTAQGFSVLETREKEGWAAGLLKWNGK